MTGPTAEYLLTKGQVQPPRSPAAAAQEPISHAAEVRARSRNRYCLPVNCDLKRLLSGTNADAEILGVDNDCQSSRSTVLDTACSAGLPITGLRRPRKRTRDERIRREVEHIGATKHLYGQVDRALLNCQARCPAMATHRKIVAWMRQNSLRPL